MKTNLHPTVDKNTATEVADFTGGVLECNCADGKVKVMIDSQVAFNHACGCTKCWKPEGALFSVVGVVPREKVSVVAHPEKLNIVDEATAIQRHACIKCGVHMFGRIENKAHPFYGLDFIHTELSRETGWETPKFAAFVSSIIEGGVPPSRLNGIRDDLRLKGLTPYDCLSPPLMDIIATQAAKNKGTFKPV